MFLMPRPGQYRYRSPRRVIPLAGVVLLSNLTGLPDPASLVARRHERAMPRPPLTVPHWRSERGGAMADHLMDGA